MRSERRNVRCAIYTRKSTDEGLDQEFNTLDAQRESAEAYITSQRGEGWACLETRYDDGGFTGGNTERPALKQLMADIEAGLVDCVVVYKVDRLSRSLLDFARMMETFERHGISFVSVTQQFNTSDSMGRLMLNVLLSFAQFERELVSERTRDKIAATRKKGKWSGGRPILGYDVDRGAMRLVVNPQEAERVRAIFDLYREMESTLEVAKELNRRAWTTKRWTTHKGKQAGGHPFDKHRVIKLLTNPLVIGKVRHNDDVYEGEHEAIIDAQSWETAQRLLRDNGRSGASPGRKQHAALLKGLLVCRPCQRAMGHTFSGKSDGPRHRYYRCQRAQKEGRDACPSGLLPAEQIEAFVLEQVGQLLAHREGQIAEMVVDELRGRGRGTDVEEVADHVASLSPDWTTLSPRERAALVGLLVGRVEFDADAGAVSITYREGVEVPA